ncbi:unnamed protein product [Rotaria magnacalcarata]|uniref:RNA helicase n=1 Tax=Rotaria magnacalcarata TaxID=392030 RepID=A0A817A5Q3_9BILA|nr:unnamed protein product [Rotaria magnacalcarata]CAF4141187.1 unnamed protein product [Rotaria magnacalcarata]
MRSASDENKLKPCLSRIIEAIGQCIQKLKKPKSASEATTTPPQQLDDSDDDLLFTHGPLNPNINKFTLDKDESDLLDQLTEDIETLLEDCFPYLTVKYSNSLADHLHEYHYDQEKLKFSRPLTKDVVPSMRKDLNGLLASSAAFSAAENGQQAIVEKFVDDYPSFKNKPSLGGTTLLYTAAFNNQFDIVKYLVGKAHCEVNARNWCDVDTDESSSSANKRNPIPGSTALHGACLGGHLPIVKYLVEQKHADCFIKNQAEKTPIQYGEQHSHIKRFFQDYLLTDFAASSSTDLPNKPVADENGLQQDYIWEYKPLQEPEWKKFSNHEAQTLHRAMLSTKKFQVRIPLQSPQGSFNVSMAKFLRSDATDSNSQKNQAWIRCRGSSVLNFDIQPVWQLMFMKYPQATAKPTSLLTVYHLDTTFNSNFTVKLNHWYTCDARTSAQLNTSINFRQKVISINIHLSMNDEPLTCNLHAFTFANDDKTMIGYLRWVPMLILNDEQNRKYIKTIDNFQSMDNVEAVPLTTDRLAKDKSHDDDGFPDMEDDMDNHDDIGDDDDDDESRKKRKKKTPSSTNGIWSVKEITTEDKTDTPPSLDNDTDTPPPKFVPPPKPSHPEPSENEKQKTKELIQRFDELQKELNNQKEHEKTVKELENKITTETDYATKPPEAMETYLLAKGQSIIKFLNEKQKLPDYYVYKIPRLFFHQNESNYTASLTGLPTHHHEFELLLQRISHLAHETQRAKHHYKQEVTKLAESVVTVMTKRIRSSHTWEKYMKYFLNILKNKKQQYLEQFDEYLASKSKLLVDQEINDAQFEPGKELESNIGDYKKSKSFEIELEKIKLEALDEFIKEEIFLPRQQFERKPTNGSVKVLNHFIDQKKKEVKTDKKYKGLDVEQLKSLAKLLRTIKLYYNCFQLQLPLFESSPELLEKIRQNTVVTISTSTGSGKSTLLPALLIAEGYDKVMVTQPRRLPCTSICERVNSTMTSNEEAEKIAGWSVSGAESDVQSPILYLTDGLLREQLLHDESLITEETKLNDSVVFFLDEVHERSINIDLCLGLLARLLTKKPHLQSKMKVVISSATLDLSVPTLFRQIKQVKFAEFKMPKLGTLYPVTKHERPNDNIIALVQELNKKRQRNEQILCFVSSLADVYLNCRLLEELSSGSIIAYPLVQSQSATEQQTYIEQGSIFFSTTVAETSLTFPNLRYVIDTGMINTPVYDFKKEHTVLEQIRAAESTIKQRLGRLGRTQPGDYYSLYDFKVEEKKFPTAQICQSEMTNIELSLRKSPEQEGLNQFKQYLPSKPSQEAIDAALKKLRRFGVITPAPNERFTKDGEGIAKLPDFNSVEISKAIYYALARYRCGRDLIAISSILGVMNTSAVLTAIPKRFKSQDGDFMTLLSIMNEVLNAKQFIPAQKFKLRDFCQQKGLQGAYHTLNQACRRYETLQKSFNLSKDYRTQAQVQSGQWELIAKALLKGYSDHVFVSLKELQGKSHRFSRYQSSKSDIDVAVLDKQSTLNRSINSAPVSLVVSRDVRYATSIRALAVLSFVGEIKPAWIEYEVERKLNLNDIEEEKLDKDKVLSAAKKKFPDVQFQLAHDVLSINGPSGSVLNAELFILQKLVEEMKIASPQFAHGSEEDETLQRNLEGLMKMLRVFNPMKWRWENQEQVEINLEQGPSAELEITIKGRNSKNRLVEREFLTALNWLRNCLVIRTPNSGLPPRLLIPQVRHKYLDVEERISHVTDSKRTLIDLWNGLKGPKATRETRMEVVAWIAICRFGCKLEGGFVRDWIVGHYTNRPKGEHADPSTWVSYNENAAKQKIPIIHKEVVPSDLDCQLSTFKYFDIDKFLDVLYKHQIECRVFREPWRYILLIDENTKTGPFTMDLIEPHVALTHDRIDFDVSNLLVEEDYTKELGMRVDIEQTPYSLDLETIVSHIRQKELKVLRPPDDDFLQRLEKMVKVRGWKVLEPAVPVIPRPPGKHRAILAPLPPSFDLYKNLVKRLQEAIPNCVVLKIEQIRNAGLEELYLGMKKMIQWQCNDGKVNERDLFHGTKGPAIDGIKDYGYDDRYSGMTTRHGGDWGHGSYFADNPGAHVHAHTAANEKDQTRVMYYNKVVLGKIHKMQEVQPNLKSAPVNYHSVHGIHPGRPNDDEYIVYRYGQALPYLKITYKA